MLGTFFAPSIMLISITELTTYNHTAVIKQHESTTDLLTPTVADLNFIRKKKWTG